MNSHSADAFDDAVDARRPCIQPLDAGRSAHLALQCAGVAGKYYCWYDKAQRAAAASESAKNPTARRTTATTTATPSDDIRGPASLKPALGPRKTDREREDRERERNAKTKSDDARRSGKLTLNDALAGEGGRTRSMAAMKRSKKKRAKKRWAWM